MAAEGLREVQDLEKWVLSYPQLLAKSQDSPPPFLVGARVRNERIEIDILAIDLDGTLVVGELKRDSEDPLYQALKYSGRLAALDRHELVSLVEQYSGKALSEIEAALDLADDQTLADLWDGPSRPIRLVLLSEDLDSDVFNTALWLGGSGVDLTVLRFSILESDGQLLFEAEVLLPSVETASRYQARQELTRRSASARTRNMFAPLIQSGQLVQGESILDANGNTIGTVKESFIERAKDREATVNMYQLTGVSWWEGAYVERAGTRVSLKDIRKIAPALTASAAPATEEAIPVATE